MQDDTFHLKDELDKMDSPETGLRPQSLDEFIGQREMLYNLSVFIASAKKRKKPLDHVLISGPPGLGKTTLAHIIAKEMNTGIRPTSGPVIEKQGDLAAILTNLEPGQILFIDEIHRVSRVIEEVMYSAMEDYTLDILIGQGPSARTMKININPFTLIGATTRTGLLSSPLRDRFGIPLRVELYNPEDLTKIVTRSAAILNVNLTAEAGAEIGKRSRGTPRIANRLLRRCRDFADIKTNGVITLDIAFETLEKLGVDPLGLDKLDRQILQTIHETYNGGPVGLGTLAATLGEEKDTLEDTCEPFLLKEGLILRTSRGRMISDKARKYLKVADDRAQLGIL